MSYKATIGGHAPGYLRDAFWDWLETIDDDHIPSIEDDVSELVSDYAGRSWTLGQLLGQLWNCTDILPWLGYEGVEEYLEGLRGAGYYDDVLKSRTYAAAVRQLKYFLANQQA